MNTNAQTTPTPRGSPIGAAIRWFTKVTAPLARPLAGRRWFPLWAVLEHRGRTSGRVYRIPVVAQPIADGFLIPVPFGERTQWVRNLVAAGGGTLRWKGADHRIVDPEVISAAEAMPSFGRVERAGIGAFGMQHFVRVRRLDA
jgi:deazaflavin-dependent oxidoreductase (nitroreductase family)